MTLSASKRLFADSISLPQFYKYLARYVRHSPASTRVVPPAKRIRVPTEPGVGIFFYPAGSWTKTSALATGPLGETTETIHPSKFQISRPIDVTDSKLVPELLYWGVGGGVQVTKNLLSGVSEGFAVNLELHGVGYRAEADTTNNKLVLRLGFSHTIDVPLVEGDVYISVKNPQLIQIVGINRGDVHQTAAKIRSLRPPEPYKGKGIRYQNEPVRRKETKKN